MNQDRSLPRRALVSVSNKTDLVPFVRGLVELGFQIISTGGTRRFLDERGIPVLDVSAYTGFPEIMDGRVKTLHPKVHGAILGRPDRRDDAAAIREHDIVPFELVVCNLYPFEQTVAQPNVTLSDAVEQIDIGGPSMVRAAAKNHAYVAVVTSPAQYEAVLTTLQRGPLSEEHRRELALAAFEMTARYDRAIADFLAAECGAGSAECGARHSELQTPNSELDWPGSLSLRFHRRSLLRYGENPHQQAAFYVEPDVPPGTLAAAEQLHGKELSYNNLLDLDAAWAVVRQFAEPAAVVIKHNNPCGCGIGTTLAEAFPKAYAGDPVSAFGSILGFNRPLDLATAEQLCVPDRFIEAVIAPGYEDEAFQALTTRPKWKKNVRLLRCPNGRVTRDEGRGAHAHHSSLVSHPSTLDYRRVTGGLLVQDRDDQPDPEQDWNTVTRREPTEFEQADLTFAWLVCRHVKSNAIVFAKDGCLVGVGAGQMSRLDSVALAARKAGDRSRAAVMASDAFFPFRDAVDEAARAGVTAVIQPGGSRNDDEAVAACNELGLAMIFTGRRHFKH